MKKTSVSKIRQKSGYIDTTEHTGELIAFLQKLDLKNISDQKAFLELTVSCIEPLIRKEIRNEINKHSKYYSPHWRTLVITGKNPRMISGKPQEVVDNLKLGDKVVSHHTFNSITPIQKQLECFSLIDNFIVYFKNDNYLKTLTQLYHKKRRNDSMHEGHLPEEINSFIEIQSNLHSFIFQIIRSYRASLDYGRIIAAPDPKNNSKEIIKLQQTRLKKSNKLINQLDQSLKKDVTLFHDDFRRLKRKFGVKSNE